ncbi:Leghemoglobin reductase [Capsicum baccatum]|uniref:Leghemoglobin reductase n=1 Tax=Capsicum baccatum TaxID=33114 RepID=A0A2G2VJ26_CAPBA|nr:Leghemoglobin reductase [Capsicum baccatum]
MLANKAEEDGDACVEFIAGKESHVDYAMVHGVVYTHREVTYVRKTEEQVEALRIYVSILCHLMRGALIHETVRALQYGASNEDIAHAHPTMSEALKASMATDDKPISHDWTLRKTEEEIATGMIISRLQGCQIPLRLAYHHHARLY